MRLFRPADALNPTCQAGIQGRPGLTSVILVLIFALTLSARTKIDTFECEGRLGAGLARLRAAREGWRA